MRPIHFLAAAAIALSLPANAQAFEARALPISFSGRQIRYLTPFDLIARFRELFPGGEPACYRLDEVNRPVLGDSPAATGEPALTDPSFGFVVWYARCLRSVARSTLLPSEMTPARLRFAYGDVYGDWASAGDPLAHLWDDVPPDVQRAVLRHQVERMIGPEAVIVDAEAAPSLDAFIDARLAGARATPGLDARPSVSEMTTAFVFAVGMTDAFLSY